LGTDRSLTSLPLENANNVVLRTTPGVKMSSRRPSWWATTCPGQPPPPLT